MIEQDVMFAKVGSIRQCLARIHAVTAGDPASLDAIDTQDIFVLNLQRAMQVAIDLAAHVVAAEQLGVPVTLRDNFTLLQRAGILSAALHRQMTAMVGFRNIAVHDYQRLDPEILKSILQHHLVDLEQFAALILDRYRLGPT